ncbi:MAG: hypothetical protein NTU44_16720, partial [Bacteroidetes bacterium]|nr:hypothetical protein [Bacteroidota bacterium]
DVNASGYINTTDALLILQRYVGPNTTFPAGDWVFESGNATLSGGNSIILNLKGLCYGDLDGNFIPAGCSPMPTLAHAGADQTITGSSTTLAGNVPQSGSGVWAIVSGTGGAVAQTGNPTSTFTGTAENTYTLTWTISTSCTQSTDTVIITFNNPIMAIPCPGIPSFSYGGQTYNTVQIGSQCWMKENLNMGTMIDGMTNASDNGIIEKYCYNNDPANCTIYGGLYDWNEMMGYANMPGTQGICPTGWHIPTDGEWCTLTTFLDATVNCNIWGWSGTNAGGKLKETGTIHWNSPNTGATNESGFTALGTGYLYFNGFFSNLNYLTYFWSSSEGSTSGGIHRYLLYVLAKVYRYDVDKTYGFSVRCVLTN